MSECSLIYSCPVTPRATRLSADDRRQAIVDAVLPVLAEQGGDLSTRDIAAAAGVAEGTLFRVFPDKAALLRAVAAEAINPATGRAEFDAILAGTADLHERVLRVAEHLMGRMQEAMKVMFAVRAHLFAAAGKDGPPRTGPPAFILDANRELLERLTGLFEEHRDELRIPPETAAVVLRSIVFGSRHPGMQLAPDLTPEQIADVIVGGVTRHGSDH